MSHVCWYIDNTVEDAAPPCHTSGSCRCEIDVLNERAEIDAMEQAELDNEQAQAENEAMMEETAIAEYEAEAQADPGGRYFG